MGRGRPDQKLQQEHEAEIERLMDEQAQETERLLEAREEEHAADLVKVIRIEEPVGALEIGKP